MAKEKKIGLGAINITMQPHSPEKYIQLFKEAKKLNCYSRISTDKAGLISSVNYLDKSKGKVSELTGDLYRFSNINTEGNWFNTLTNQHAEDDELNSINIPENLKPNSSRFSYIFFPQSHILFYESYYDGHTLGHTSALKLINGTLNDPRLVEKYGVIDTTVIPSREKLTQALSIARMDSLTMLITRPNPDNHSDIEKEVLKRLKAQNVSKYKHELVSVSGTSIEPDSDTKILADVAAKNGMVQVKGRDAEDHPIEYKTSDHPWQHKDYYDPNIETAYSTFHNAVFDVREEVESWENKNE